MFILESSWIYLIHVLSFVLPILIMLALYCASKKTHQESNLQQESSVQQDQICIQLYSLPSTNLFRQISTNDSIYSFNTAIENSTVIVQEKNETIQFEFELPTYDEFIKLQNKPILDTQISIQS